MSDNNINTAKKSLIFHLNVSIRYNSYRCVFFQRWDSITNFLSIVLGSGAIYALSMQYQSLALITALIITIISALSLVIGFGRKASQHAEFMQKYSNLLTPLLNDPVDSSTLAKIKQQKLQYDISEPHTLTVLGQICYNQQVHAEGLDISHLTKISGVQRFFAQYIDIFPYKLFNN